MLDSRDPTNGVPQFLGPRSGGLEFGIPPVGVGNCAATVPAHPTTEPEGLGCAEAPRGPLNTEASFASFLRLHQRAAEPVFVHHEQPRRVLTAYISSVQAPRPRVQPKRRRKREKLPFLKTTRSHGARIVNITKLPTNQLGKPGGRDLPSSGVPKSRDPKRGVRGFRHPILGSWNSGGVP